MRTSVEVTVEVEIDRPPEAVWAVVADAGRTAEWIDEFTESRSEGPDGVGQVVHYTLDRGASGTYEIVEWDPPRCLAWDGPPLRMMGGGARPRGSHDLVSVGERGTRLVTRYRPELSGAAALMRPYLARWLRRQRRIDAQTLKRLIEAV
jgi:uncharacterized protein YndB with AHSA1/START domain